MKAKELLSMTDSNLLEIAHVEKCTKCKVPLQETITGCRKVNNGYMCSDCYFEEMGNEIEAHPIGIPQMHRGA